MPALSSRRVRLGLVNGDVPDDPALFTPWLIEGWQTRGVSCLAVAFSAAGADRSPARMEQLRELLAAGDVAVSQFSSVNANLVHPDRDVRSDAVDRVARVIPSAQALGARVIISGAGTCSPRWRTHFYDPHRGNYLPEAEDRIVDSLSRIAELIDPTDLVYAIECHQLGPMRSPEVIRRVLDRVDHPRVVANFDPVNLIDAPHKAFLNEEAIPAMIDIVGNRYAPTCHIKDIVVLEELPFTSREAPPGRGLIDPRTVFAAALRLPGDGDVDIIVEHLGPAEAEVAFRHVRDQALAMGLELVGA